MAVDAATVGTLSKMYATDLGSYRAAMDRLPAFTYLLTLHWTISAGTSEIQRNIMAQRGLGLPR